MIIKFSPQGRNDQLSVKKRGDVLTINGERFDFRDIPEGAVLPSSAVDSEFVVGDITRTAGELTITLLLPHGEDATTAARFPEPLLNPLDGNVSIPQ